MRVPGFDQVDTPLDEEPDRAIRYAAEDKAVRSIEPVWSVLINSTVA